MTETNGTQTGVCKDDLVMPVIDFSPFVNPTSTASSRLPTARAVYHAFRTSGFLYLSNAGIPPSTVTQAFTRSASFFSRPQSEKDSLAWTTPTANRGYVSTGREKVTQSTDAVAIAALRATNPDLKESMEIGREGVEGQPNRWPSHLDADGEAFTEFFKSLHLQLKDLHVKVMQAIALGMGLEEGFFDSYTDAGDNNLRLLHYPRVKKAVFRDNPDQVRAGEHSDYGSVTLLFQDQVGGLEVKSPKGTWVRATPIPDTIVVNAGDLLARWSNDRIKSTRHRVIQPPAKEGSENEKDGDDDDATYPPRYSMAYFCNPNFDAWIEALPGTYADGEEEVAEKGEGQKKYPGINSGDYLVQRLAATY